MLPGDYKRKYRFRTDRRNEQRLFYWMLAVCALIMAALWYFTAH